MFTNWHYLNGCSMLAGSYFFWKHISKQIQANVDGAFGIATMKKLEEFLVAKWKAVERM